MANPLVVMRFGCTPRRTQPTRDRVDDRVYPISKIIQIPAHTLCPYHFPMPCHHTTA